MLANPSTDEPSAYDLNAPSETPSEKRARQESGDMRTAGSQATRRIRSNPLLNIPIGRRLALGFLIPALIATLTLSSVGVQSQQRLLQESIFYQNLFNAYTSLTAGESVLEQIHSNVQKTVTYAAQSHPIPEILKEDETVVRGLAAQFNTVLATYLQQDLLVHSAGLAALFTEAGHAAQIEEQRSYSEEAQVSWQAYRAIQGQAFSLINAGAEPAHRCCSSPRRTRPLPMPAEIFNP